MVFDEKQPVTTTIHVECLRECVTRCNLEVGSVVDADQTIEHRRVADVAVANRQRQVVLVDAGTMQVANTGDGRGRPQQDNGSNDNKGGDGRHGVLLRTTSINTT